MRLFLLSLLLLLFYSSTLPLSASAQACSGSDTCYVSRQSPSCVNRACSFPGGGTGSWCCPTTATPCVDPLSCTQTPIGSNCQSQLCSYPSGGTGNFCCNITVVPTLPAGNCTSVPGQFCAPSQADCTDNDGVVILGTCASNWFCCAPPPPDTTPGPTPPGGGLPGGGYTPGSSNDPRARGFTPLKYPCDAEADPEFAPQRPYPASPCRPLIPDSTRLSFSCGKSLDVQGNFEFPSSVDLGTTLPFPQDPQYLTPGTVYFCNNLAPAECFCNYPPVLGPTPPPHLCEIKRVGFDIKLDLANARIPIVGNTQDPLDDATKVNNYLNWYFNGTVQHSEQQDVLTYTPPTSPSGAPLNSPDQLGAEIDEFFRAGAAGYLVWQYGDQPGNGVSSGDQYTWYQGSPVCQTLRDAANANPGKFVGVNAPSLPQVTGRIQPALSYLKSCGVKVVRVWGVPVSGSANISGLRQVLDEASANGIQVIIVLADYSNSSDPILPGSIRTDPTQWYATGYLSTGYRSYVTNLVSSLGNHPALYAYELANEPHCGGKDACVSPYISWASDVSSAIKSINNSVKVGIGQKASENTTRGDSPGVGSPTDFTRSNTPSGITTSSGHYYNVSEKSLAMMALAQSATLNKPFYVGEAGFSTSTTGTGSSSQLSGIDRLINYSGPLKKLLPYVIQKNIKDVLNGGAIGDLYHDYFVIDGKRLGDPLLTWSEIFKYVPLSSLEDITGEFTVGLIPNQQPGNPGDQGVDPGIFGDKYFKNGQVLPDTTGKNAIFLTIKPEAGDQTDSRLYFPHVRSVDVLSTLLASTFRPGYKFNTKELNAVVNNLPDDTNPPQYPQYDYLRPGENSRNTQVIPNSPAPAPLINYGGYDQMCDLSEVRVNPGDSLVGSAVTARLGYTQVFRYTPRNSAVPPGEIGLLGSCGTLTGSDCANQIIPPDGQDPNAKCQSPYVCECVDYLSNLSDGYYCIDRTGGPPKNKLPTEARVGVFVKSPMLDLIYTTLVTGKDSIFNRFFPKRGQWEDPRPGGKDIPAAADAVYSGTGLGFTAPETGQTYEAPQSDSGVTTGKHTSDAKIYFKHLGSIMDYFLGAGQDNKNLQRLLRPQGFSSGSLGTFPPTSNANLQQVADQYHVPAEFLDAIWYLESGRGASGSNCSNCATGACGPMQIGIGAYNNVTDPSENLDRCNLPDAFIIAARVLLDKKYCTIQTASTCTSLHANPATAYLTVGSVSSNEYYPTARYNGSDGCWGNNETKIRWGNCTNSSDASTCYSYCDAVHCVVTNPSSPPLPQSPSFIITNPQCSKQTYTPPGILQ